MCRSKGNKSEQTLRIKELLGILIVPTKYINIFCSNKTVSALKKCFRSILQKGQLTYEISGVSIVAGNHLVSAIKPITCSTKRTGTLSIIGGFGGLFDVKAAGYNDPILISGTDGVGTKLKVNKSDLL